MTFEKEKKPFFNRSSRIFMHYIQHSTMIYVQLVEMRKVVHHVSLIYLPNGKINFLSMLNIVRNCLMLKNFLIENSNKIVILLKNLK